MPLQQPGYLGGGLLPNLDAWKVAPQAFLQDILGDVGLFRVPGPQVEFYALVVAKEDHQGAAAEVGQGAVYAHQLVVDVFVRIADDLANLK